MKKLRTIMIIFALILTASIVYAAATSLDIAGTATLSSIKPTTKPVEEAQSDKIITSGVASGEWIDGTTIKVSLGEQGASVTFYFTIENTSAFDMKITDITVTDENGAPFADCPLGFTTDFESFSSDDKIIQAGGASKECLIQVSWKSGESFASASGDIDFKIHIDFQVGDDTL